VRVLAETATAVLYVAFTAPVQSWGRFSLDKKSPDVAGASSPTPNRLHQREIWGKHAAGRIGCNLSILKWHKKGHERELSGPCLKLSNSAL
jgi:hypothetical protein